MQIVKEISHARSIVNDQKKAGRSIGLVPTMGALHEGHLSLIRQSANENDTTIVSIFVNPLQFGANEDLENYPRTLEIDAKIAASANADFIFCPSPVEMLGDSMLAFVDIETLGDTLCGPSRPGHFRGVCTIVAKLFNVVLPQRAYFGQKDMQQFVILKKIAQDLNFDIELIRCPIIREHDGLAMSSRNKYLSVKERKDALVIYRALRKAEETFESNETKASALLSEIAKILSEPTSARIDYASIVDKNMQHVERVQKGDIIAIAVFIGSTRLIDNYVFGESMHYQ
jgi:pantoate--beta-alanine ligase